VGDRVIGFEGETRYAELARRVFGPDVDIVPPGITLETDRPEYALHKREALVFAAQSIGAVAAQFARGGIQNPLTSQNIVVVKAIVAIGQSFSVGIDPTTPITAGPSAFVRDTGWPRLNNPYGIVAAFDTSADNTYAFGPGFWVPIGTYLPIDVVLRPGHNLGAIALSVNVSAQLGFLWYVRKGSPEELTI